MKHVFSPALLSKNTFRLLLATFALMAGLLQAELTEQQKLVPLEVDAPDKGLSKIVIIAGVPSNKPGQHEYFAGCALMMQWLKQSPGVWPVLVAEGWPKNEAILDNAKAVLIFMDGGEKCAILEPARWSKMKQLMDNGVGFVALHQAVEVPAAQAADFKSWLGAVWQKDIGSRGHWDMSFADFPKHETLRGVQPFAAPKDGWLFNLHFAEKGVTPLLTGLLPDSARSTADAKAHAGRAEVIAWAYERDNGGRSVGFTGCDLHKNWDQESQRRFVANALLWTAKVPVPDAGAAVPFTEADLAANWDRKALGVAKTLVPAPAPPGEAK